MPDNYDDLLKRVDSALGRKPVSAPKQKQADGLNVPSIVDDELKNLGYGDNARLALVSNLGRENSWNPNTIFGGHDDPANGQRNRGLISWQKDRRTNLENYVRQNGGDFTPSESNLRLQTRFLDKELQGSYGHIGRQIKNPNLSLNAAYPLLQKYIKYQPQYESNNKHWESKARAQGIGQSSAMMPETDYSDLLSQVDNALAPPSAPEQDYGKLLGEVDKTLSDHAASLPQTKPAPEVAPPLIPANQPINNSMATQLQALQLPSNEKDGTTAPAFDESQPTNLPPTVNAAPAATPIVETPIAASTAPPTADVPHLDANYQEYLKIKNEGDSPANQAEYAHLIKGTLAQANAENRKNTAANVPSKVLQSQVNTQVAPTVQQAENQPNTDYNVGGELGINQSSKSQISQSQPALYRTQAGIADNIDLSKVPTPQKAITAARAAYQIVGEQYGLTPEQQERGAQNLVLNSESGKTGDYTDTDQLAKVVLTRGDIAAAYAPGEDNSAIQKSYDDQQIDARIAGSGKADKPSSFVPTGTGKTNDDELRQIAEQNVTSFGGSIAKSLAHPFESNDDEAINQEYERLKELQLTAEEKGKAEAVGDALSKMNEGTGYKAADYVLGSLAARPGASTGGAIGLGGEVGDFFGGLIRYRHLWSPLTYVAEKAANLTGVKLEPDDAYKLLNKWGQQAQIIDAGSVKGTDFLGQAGNFTTRTVGQTGKFIGLTAATGGSGVIAFALDGAATSAGRGDTNANVVGNAAKNAMFGAFLGIGGKVGGFVKETALAGGDSEAIAELAKSVYKVGTVGTLAAGQTKLEGGTNEEALKAGLLMAAQDFAFTAMEFGAKHEDLNGRVVRIADGEEHKNVMFTEENGELGVYDVTGKVPESDVKATLIQQPDGFTRNAKSAIEARQKAIADAKIESEEKQNGSKLSTGEIPAERQTDVAASGDVVGENGNANAERTTNVDESVSANKPPTAPQTKTAEVNNQPQIGDKVDFNGNGTGTITKINDDGSVAADVDGRKLPTVAEPGEFSVIKPAQPETANLSDEKKPLDESKGRVRDAISEAVNADDSSSVSGTSQAKERKVLDEKAHLDFFGKPKGEVIKENLTTENPVDKKGEVTNNVNPDGQSTENTKSESNLPIREPRQPKGGTAQGKATSVKIPDSDKSYDAKYSVREVDDVVPSHNPFNFQPNEDYYHVNDRHYDKEKQYQTQVETRSKGENFNPSRLINNAPTVEVGTPVIDADGNVLGGNSRSMMLHRVYADENPTAANNYRKLLTEDAGVYGIKPEDIAKFKKPVLVREVSDSSIESQHAITELNKSSTTDLTVKERAVAESGKVSDSAIDYITGQIENAGSDATLNDALNLHGAKIVNKLIEDGVFSGGERNTLLDGGKITEDGKKRVERLLTGRVFENLEQMESVPPYLKKNLERVISPLVKTEADTDWSITPVVREAIDLLSEFQGKGSGLSLRDYAKQPSMFRGGFSDEALAVAESLKQSPNNVSRDFKGYAREFQDAKDGSALFGAMTPEQAFSEFFGKDKSLRKTAEERAQQKTVRETADKSSLLSDVRIERDGNALNLNAQAAEITRFVEAQMSGQELAKLSDIDGLTLDARKQGKNEVQDFADHLETLANSVEESGGDRATLDAYRDHVLEAAKENGIVTLHTDEATLEHERTHEATYIGSRNEQNLTKRHSEMFGDISKTVAEHPHFQTFKTALETRENRGLSNEHAALEALAYLPRDYADFGLSREQARDTLATVLTEYQNANPDGLKAFTPQKTGELYKIIQDIENEKTNQTAKTDNINTVNSGGTELGRARADESKAAAAESRQDNETGNGGAQSESEGGRLPGQSGGVVKTGAIKQSKTPETLKAAEIPAESRDYQSVTNADQQKYADDLLDKGIESATDWLNNAFDNKDPNSGATTTVAVELMKAAGRSGDLVELNRIADKLVPSLTEYGQAIQAVSTLSAVHPDSAPAFAAKIKKKFLNEDLTSRDLERAKAVATDVHETAQAAGVGEALHAKTVEALKQAQVDRDAFEKALDIAAGRNSKLEIKLNDAARTIRNLKAQVKRYVENKVSKPRTATTQSKLLAELKAKEPDLLERIKKQFGDMSLRMTAYHGSPHLFDKFDISKLGTGEGAQAYGHGLYFTDKESVADYYRETLAAGEKIVDANGQSVVNTRSPIEYNRALNHAQTEFLYHKGNAEKAIAQVEQDRKSNSGLSDRYYQETIQHLRDFDGKGYKVVEDKGAKYVVDLKPEQSDYLLWDKPLSEQSEKVQAALSSSPTLKIKGVTIADHLAALKYPDIAADFNIDGDTIYKSAAEQFGDTYKNSDSAASEYLKSLGIRGIKYLDGQSRTKGEGSHNYVIFDDADVTIEQTLRKTADTDFADLTDWSTLHLLENLPKGESLGEFKNALNDLTGGKLSADQIDEIHAAAVDNLRTARPLTDEQRAINKNRSEHYAAADRYNDAPKRILDEFDQSKDGKDVDKFTRTVLETGIRSGATEQGIFAALATRSESGNPTERIQKAFPDLSKPEVRAAMVEAGGLLKKTRDALTTAKIKADRIYDGTAADLENIKAAQAANNRKASQAKRQAANFYNSLVKTRKQAAFETLSSFRKANLLTAPKRLFNDILSNAANMTAEEATRAAGSLADIIAARATGERAFHGISGRAIKRSVQGIVFADSTLKAISGDAAHEGFNKSGVDAAYNIVRYGASNEALAKQNLTESHSGDKFGKIGKTADAYINTVFRTISGGDALLKVVAFRRSLEEMAAIQAKNEKRADPHTNVKARTDEILREPTEVMQQMAVEYAEEATFQNKNALSSAISAAKKFGVGDPNKRFFARTVIDTVVPFDKTPTNIVLRLLDHTPVGAVKAGLALRERANPSAETMKEFNKAYRSAVASDLQTDAFNQLAPSEQRAKVAAEVTRLFKQSRQREFSRLVGRSVTGTLGGLALGYLMASRGFAAGSMSPNQIQGDKNEANEFFDRSKKGIENRSVLIPNIGRFVLPSSPFLISFTLGATLYEQSRLDKKLLRTDPGGAAWEGLKSTAKDVAFEQPILKTTADYLGSNQNAGQRVGGILSGFIPASALLKDVGEVADTKARTSSPSKEAKNNGMLSAEASGFKNTFVSKIPVARNYLADESDFKDPNLRGGWLRRAGRFLDPFNSQPANEYSVNGEASYADKVRGNQMSKDEAVKAIQAERANGNLTKAKETKEINSLSQSSNEEAFKSVTKINRASVSEISGIIENAPDAEKDKLRDLLDDKISRQKQAKTNDGDKNAAMLEEIYTKHFGDRKTNRINALQQRIDTAKTPRLKVLFQKQMDALKNQP